MVKIEHIDKANYLEIIIAGEIDASSSIHLDEAMSKAVASHSKIIVNLSDLEYISSAGLGVFMSYIDEIDSKGIRLSLFGLSESVFHIFEILGIDQLLEIAETESLALKCIDEISA